MVDYRRPMAAWSRFSISGDGFVCCGGFRWLITGGRWRHGVDLPYQAVDFVAFYRGFFMVD